jgi:hypothetical protein
MQTESDTKELMALMAPTSSTEHSGELDRHQPPLAGAAGVVKRKRTKRPRHQPPASSASSSESTTTEEEDMAHCLILLAQGGGGAAVDSKPSPSPVVVMPQQPEAHQPSPPVVAKSSSERYTSRKYTESADGAKARFYVYECRTCNKCFPTFQALGGHRASHKKPRLPPNSTGDEDIGISAINNSKPAPTMSPAAPPPRADVTTALSLNSHVVIGTGGSTNFKSVRVHECSICGAEFASGQALGGHMRRHRPLNAPPAITGGMADTTTTKKLIQGTSAAANINLELDLNLPAPSDSDEQEALPAPVVLGLGQFNDGNKAGLMLTASALVDCHY